jgi:hypothetical protein
VTAAATPDARPRAISRRHAVVAGGVALVALSGCTSEGSEPSGSSSSPAAPPSSTAASTDPDRAALDRAAALSSELLTQVTGAGAAVDPGGRLAALHTAHLEALAEATGATASPTTSPSASPSNPPQHQGVKRSGARLRRQELSAQRELAGLAVAAESGAVARMLASMSAGIAAGVTTTPRQEPR